MIELRSRSAADTRAIAGAVAGVARGGDLIVLAGRMGAGKTVFAQGFARAVGVAEPVTSPTYTLVHTYRDVACNGRDPVTLHHADLFRLERTADVEDLAIPELLDDDAIVLVEWGDIVDLGEHLKVDLRAGDDQDSEDDDGGDAGRREITISCGDHRWQTRRDRLRTALQEWSA